MEGDSCRYTVPTDVPGVSEEKAREELEKLLADKEFNCTERNRHFLRFVAEEAFAARGPSIKAYTIAVDVFGRPTSFDATTDPIVRIEATRLRAALARYYEHQPLDRLRIELPRGRYVPLFFHEKRDEHNGTGENEISVLESAPNLAQTPDHSRLYPKMRTRWLAAIFGLFGGALVGVVFLYMLGPASPPLTISQRPSVSLEFDGGGDEAAEGTRVREATLVALSRFQSLRMLSDEYTQALSNKVAADYQILLKYNTTASVPSVWWQVIDNSNGETVESGETRLGATSISDGGSVEELARRLSLRLAGAGGVINSRVLAKEIENPTLGNGCILRAYRAIQSGYEKELKEARSCLEQTIAVQPAYADAMGVLALVLVRQGNYDQPTPDLDKALKMVRDAALIAPDSANVAYAATAVEFLYGRVDLATAAARHALEINPYNGAITARLSEMLYFAGAREEALLLANRASAVDGVVYRDAELTLAMDAYVHANYVGSLNHLERAGREMTYGPAMLKVATLGQMGSASDSRLAREALLARWPQFEKTFHPMMIRIEADQGLVKQLADGLQKAGLKID